VLAWRQSGFKGHGDILIFMKYNQKFPIFFRVIEVLIDSIVGFYLWFPYFCFFPLSPMSLAAVESLCNGHS